MRVILNNKLASENDEQDAIRDGWYFRKPDGKLRVTQAALTAYLAAQDKMERLASLLKSAFVEKGADVEEGAFDAAMFEELRKSPAWREAFVALGGNPDDVLAKTEQKPYTMLRVFPKDEKQKGKRK